jgi:hypothetical protein
MNSLWRPLAIIAAVLGLLWWTPSLASESNWPDHLLIGTASPGGTYYVYGEGLGKILTRALDLPVVPESVCRLLEPDLPMRADRQNAEPSAVTESI